MDSQLYCVGGNDGTMCLGRVDKNIDDIPVSIMGTNRKYFLTLLKPQ